MKPAKKDSKEVRTSSVVSPKGGKYVVRFPAGKFAGLDVTILDRHPKSIETDYYTVAVRQEGPLDLTTPFRYKRTATIERITGRRKSYDFAASALIVAKCLMFKLWNEGKKIGRGAPMLTFEVEYHSRTDLSRVVFKGVYIFTTHELMTAGNR